MTTQTVNIDTLQRAMRESINCAKLDHTSFQIGLLDKSHAERLLVETFIEQIFLRSYQARLNSFYPLLLSICVPETHKEFAAVAGIRPAGGEPLFLEHYLDKPIEKILNVERNRIIEVGNLAPATVGQARWLIATLNAFMLGAGFTHVVFTAVLRLKNAFSRMGLPLTELAEAHGENLPTEERYNWGSYYEHSPRVYVGDLRIGEEPLKAITNADPTLQSLCSQASTLGQAFAYGLQQH